MTHHRHIVSAELLTLYLCKPILSLVNFDLCELYLYVLTYTKPAVSQIRLKWSVFVYLYMCHCEHHTLAYCRFLC